VIQHKTTILPLVFTLLAFGVVTISISQSTYAQTDDIVYTSKQTTLSGNLENDPVAQDILKKIEQSKKLIAELEKRNYDRLEAQRELEEKREQVLEILEQDLKEWEELWIEYSPRNAFKKFADKKPEYVQGIFWDQFDFQESKAKAGKDALEKVFVNGGTLKEARQAYLKAAETKYIELIAANSKFNVKHNLAIYGQQVLFNPQGQFVKTPITGEELRKYFEDYRTNPEYLKTNPEDSMSWNDMRRATPHDECREGYVLIHRFHASDDVCVTKATSEMWIRYGMGEPAKVSD